MPVTQSQIKRTLFALGTVVATPGALELLTRAEQTPLEFLARHSRADWGECDSEDAKENDLSVKAGSRILSVYRTRTGQKIWIITEADRKRHYSAVAKRVLRLKRARKRANVSSPKAPTFDE